MSEESLEASSESESTEYAERSCATKYGFASSIFPETDRFVPAT